MPRYKGNPPEQADAELRSLRIQADRMERERREIIERDRMDVEKAWLRIKIKEGGETPCA